MTPGPTDRTTTGVASRRTGLEARRGTARRAGRDVAAGGRAAPRGVVVMRMPPRPAGSGSPRQGPLARVVVPLALLSILLASGCAESGAPSADPTLLDAPDPSWSEVEIASEEPTPPPTPEPTPARAVELRKAVAAGEVSIAARGDGLERLALTVTSKTREPLRVVVNPGTVFDARSAATQAMVVLAKAVIPVEPGATEEVSLDVACSEMHKDQPGSDDTFRLVKRALPLDLTRLLKLETFAEAAFRVRQFAVWTILDDPARDGFVRLGTLGVGSGPSSAEIAEIRRLFAEAGIDPKHYRATR